MVYYDLHVEWQFEFNNPHPQETTLIKFEHAITPRPRSDSQEFRITELLHFMLLINCEFTLTAVPSSHFFVVIFMRIQTDNE